jgi:starch synthase
MPSVYEPCGLNQMYSLRYGTVPIVHRTGGLADTVRPWRPSTGDGTGILFDHHDEAGLRWAIEAALDLYRDRDAWRRLVLNGMEEDFSWDVQSRSYEQLYRAVQKMRSS